MGVLPAYSSSINLWTNKKPKMTIEHNAAWTILIFKKQNRTETIKAWHISFDKFMFAGKKMQTFRKEK